MKNTFIKKGQRGIVFLILSFISLTVITPYGSVLSFDVPFPGIIITFILLLCYFIVNRDKELKCNVIISLLALRAVLFAINAILNVGAGYALEELSISFISIMIFVGVSSFGEENDVKYVFTAFSFIISLQLCLGFILKGTANKSVIVAGVGASNYAASFLLVCIAYLLFNPGKILSKLTVVFDVIMLIMTLSFGAYMALAVILLIYAVKRFDWRKKSTVIIALLSLTVTVAVLACLLNLNIGSPIYEKIQSKLSALLSGNFKSFGSSRIEVYTCSFNNFKKNIFFGPIINPVDIQYDTVYHFDNERAHNFLLESLVRYGLAGTVINAAMLILIIKKYIRLKGTKYKKIADAVFIAFIAALVHGLVEPNFFSKDFEFVIWLLLGTMWGLPVKLLVRKKNGNSAYAAGSRKNKATY